jgi:uncharacterized membrane protein YjfL (UPF0719 family)
MEGAMEEFISIKYVVNALVFSVLGLVVLTVAFIVLDKLTPGNLWKEIIEDQNIALAIIVGAMMLAIASIISSAIHG